MLTRLKEYRNTGSHVSSHKSLKIRISNETAENIIVKYRKYNEPS
jgi:hypothetical protein